MRSRQFRPPARPALRCFVTRSYEPLPEPEYPFHDVGIREVENQVWIVSFLDFDPGLLRPGGGRIEPALDPFGPEKVSTMSPE